MRERINLQDLIILLAGKSEITKKEAELFLREYLNVINEGLLNDHIVKLKNLGSFKTALINERESIDVNTGERVLLPAHYRISYAPDTQLAQTINEPFALFEGVELINDSILANTKAEDEDEDEEDTVAEAPMIETVPIIEEVPVQILENIEKKPEIVTEKKPEIIVEKNTKNKEDIDPIEEFTKIFNPPRDEEGERPIFRAKRKKRKRFPWEWILCVLVLFGVGWFYYTIESREKEEIESIRATFISPAKKTTLDSIKEHADSVVIDSETIINNATVDTTQQNSSIPSLLLRNSVEAIKEKTPIVEEKKEEDQPVVPVETPKEQTTTPAVTAEKPSTPTTTISNAQQPKVRTIRAGESLRVLALEEYGDKAFWIYLYLENKSSIANPNNIPIGAKIVIPPAAKYGINKNNPESIRKANELARQNRN